MTTLDHIAHATGREGFNLLGFAGRALRVVYHAMRMRSDRAALHAMPDHLLKDIGIGRSQIEHYTPVRFTLSGKDA